MLYAALVLFDADGLEDERVYILLVEPLVAL